MMGAPGPCDHEIVEGFLANNGTQRAFITASGTEGAPEDHAEASAWMRQIGFRVLASIDADALSARIISLWFTRAAAADPEVALVEDVCVALLAWSRHADNGARRRRRAQIVGAHPPSDTLDVPVPCFDVDAISNRVVAPDPLASQEPTGTSVASTVSFPERHGLRSRVNAEGDH